LTFKKYFDIIYIIKEKVMVSLFNAGIVMAIVIIGVGITSYRIGLRRGAEALVEILVEEGILTEDED
jgi:hypothetical protein